MALDSRQSVELNLYTCGPTVYNLAHIGNLRAYVFADLIYRAKKFAGENPKWVMNITDVDDKTIKNTIAEFGAEAGVGELLKYTDRYYQSFLADSKKLNILTTEIKFIKVSEVIPPIQDFIVKLIDKGYAYKADDGSTYFSIAKYQQAFGNYGQLVGEKFLAGKKIGGSTGSPQARIKADEYTKDDLSDFALWKARETDDANIFWSQPVLGEGRPGWHIECSVINYVAFNGQTTDIHTGGVDLKFPHHTNEIAQSEALTGKTFVNEWLHSEHLLVDDKKMSKSLGNVYTLEDLEKKGYNPLAYRYLLLQTNYKQKVNFTWPALEAAQKGYDNLKKKIEKLRKESETDVEKNKSDPLSAWGLLWKEHLKTYSFASILGTLQLIISDKNLDTKEKLNLVEEIDRILGLKLV